MFRPYRIPVLLVSMAALFAVGTTPAQVPLHSVSILPATPTAFDTVIARVTTPTCFLDPRTVRVSQSAGALRVDVRYTPNCVLTGGSDIADIMLGQLPPGAYTVRVYISPTLLAASAQFSVADGFDGKPPLHPLVNYTDHWWNAQESGWGLSIMQHTSDRIFATWYVYDQGKNPVWYTLQPGQWLTHQIYKGPVYKTSGPYFGGVFNPSQVTVTAVGEATLTFPDYTSGTFSYTIEGVTGSKAITRLPF